MVAAPARAYAEKDIVDTAVAAGSFKTLATALKAADLIDTLKGEGPFTVFALELLVMKDGPFFGPASAAEHPKRTIP